jgi:ubiquinol-cytochrome c reductase cytochrome b subunit
MKALVDWFEDRTGVRSLLHETLFERIPGGARWRYVWGSTLAFAFAVQVITGIFLWMCYSPSAQTAWESVYYIQNDMQGGWLLRGLHHFMAQAMVVLMGLHFMQVVIDGAYRAPREVNFWLGLVLMQIVLALSLTGYLLPWDQKGYWATRVATNLLSVVPWIGPQLQQLVVGGADYGHLTLTRFFALHAGVLPGLLVVFLIMHVSIFRRHGICHKLPAKGPDAMFWPDQVLKDAVACLAVLAVVLVLIVQPIKLFSSDSPIEAAHLGAELGAPADPANQYSAARPEWYFLFLFQFLKLFEGWGEHGELLGAVVIPVLVMLALAVMPFLGRWNLGHRFNIGLLVILLGGIGYLTAAAINEDNRARWTDAGQFSDLLPTIEKIGTDDAKIAAHFENDAAKIDDYKKRLAAYEKVHKSEEYLRAVAQANEEAERVVTLAAAPTRIPFGGAATLLRHDPKTQGPKLFAARCAGCHTHAPPPANGEPEPIGETKSSAPNLHAFASRAWLKGLLDPKHIAGPNYFGHTSHNEGSMAGFVNETLAMWPPEEVQQVVMALSAEAKLKSQAQADRKDAAGIEAGRKLIADAERCASCHKFHDAGELGSAPDLTGYGSREWLIGMISNPKGERFYRDDNDRMPSFAVHAGDSPQNILSSQAMGLIVDWLRGEWYEPPVATPAETAAAK